MRRVVEWCGFLWSIAACVKVVCSGVCWMCVAERQMHSGVARSGCVRNGGLRRSYVQSIVFWSALVWSGAA